ncbi:methionine--tRNA ligase [Candidatus Wolfebacteria bacterium CG10_big_fil_rev_8_21_14_0_10_31_9]|uniref:Methionine--tRNA ligase n=1 Tax=Candidatus Wolfebacteria bacterium CG10_big_fil_rev_8_21_14_0_10_31_9 TaxID=1975070 RepID=A0A2H0RCW1_9BACT|nr:MAG: methionine--tRNA ligase [Candidatus Wolfebacteria bacterium CG10_big_fil_rev_8_21_14_0_10_31_9]
MKFYITTSIAYANGSPHIGFALESIQADVLARYHRQKGDEVFFLTGTDEHGTKIYKTAQKAGKDTQKFVDEISEEFKGLKSVLNLSWGDFIRTTDQKKHWPAVFEIWKKLDEKKLIEAREFEGLYCIGCESFKLVKDLVDGKCPEHLVEPEKIKEKNYFFKLSEFGNNLKQKIESDEIKIIPQSRKNEVLSFINQGLTDISISRPKEKLPWGISVPGDDSQVIYVWIDALTNYISALGFGNENNENFKKFWPADVHCIGKDILRFHAVIWPAILMACELQLPKNIFVHGHITSGNQKMSKSLGNVISPVELVNKYGADAVRYYLLREIPSIEDGDYSEEKFINRYNGDLANGLGNFSARVLTLASREVNLQINTDNTNKEISSTEKVVEQKISEFKFNEAIEAIWKLISFGDIYINQEKPWGNTNVKEKNDVIVRLVLILEHVAKLIIPFLPETSKKILESIKHEGNIIKINKGENLFQRIN